jgi:two-component system, response regulator
VNQGAPEIIIVDDRRQDAELVADALRRRVPSVNTLILKDGAEVIEYIEGLEGRTAPRVILLDLQMPRVDGFEVLERLKVRSTTRTIPIVVLTSSDLARDVRRAYELCANSYVVKATKFEELMDSVGTVAEYWLHINRTPSAEDS